MKFDEVDDYVEGLFNRPAQPVWGERVEVQPAVLDGREASPAGQSALEGGELYYWHEPDEPVARRGQGEAPWVAWEEEAGEPLGAWGVVKGLLLLAIGLLLIMGLSEAGVV